MKPKFSSTRIAVLALGLATVLGAGTCAMAQTAAQPDGLAAEERLALREERRAERQAERAARLEGDIAFLRARLMVTAAQAPLWDAFAETLRDEEAARAQAREARRARRDSLLGQPSLPERLERRWAESTARSERLNIFMNVLGPLYGALDVQQKAIADRFLEVNDGRIRIDEDD